MLWFAAPPTFHTGDIEVVVTADYAPSSVNSLIFHPPKVPMTHGGSLALFSLGLQVIGHAKGIETAPLALLRLRMLTLDSVSSSPCSSDFLSASVARKRSVTVSHSSGSSSNRKPTQMMQVAARRTMLKITSCFRTSIAKHNVRKQMNGVKGSVLFFNSLVNFA